MKDFLKDVFTIACGLCAAIVIMSVLVILATAFTTDATSAALAGEVAANATADAIEHAFLPFLMIGLVILVARFMRRRKAKPS